MSALGGVDCNVGIPAAFAACNARTLLPASSNTSAGGPMNAIPASTHARARSGFSLRKAVAGIDRVSPRLLRRPDDLGNI